jgi:hypothetical protein
MVGSCNKYGGGGKRAAEDRARDIAKRNAKIREQELLNMEANVKAKEEKEKASSKNDLQKANENMLNHLNTYDLLDILQVEFPDDDWETHDEEHLFKRFSDFAKLVKKDCAKLGEDVCDELDASLKKNMGKLLLTYLPTSYGSESKEDIQYDYEDEEYDEEQYEDEETRLLFERADKLAAKLGTKVEKLTSLGNGSVGARFTNGLFRIVTGPSREYLNKIRSSKRNSKQLSKRAAMRSFNRYYAHKSYKSNSSREHAKIRDLCHSKSPRRTTTLTAFRRSPHKYDYPGLDDGSNCPKGYKKVASKSPSPKATAALKNWRLANPNKGRPVKGGSKKKSAKKSPKKY